MFSRLKHYLFRSVFISKSLVIINVVIDVCHP